MHRGVDTTFLVEAEVQEHPGHEAAEAKLYERLRQLVKESDGALVSIAHRPGVAAFHDQFWGLQPGSVGEARHRLVAT